ncbi:hypothetical protein TNCV_1339361 [Trichonephila clavipes]|uniref:Uncharacterized protein n=1 Tax=Trichonephila clavipes TaxID=2585209 RepID=A0A8X6UZ06_TRICX|nr:hypothetical protein TNCV_1339361 [Trichonephila clavipes]
MGKPNAPCYFGESHNSNKRALNRNSAKRNSVKRSLTVLRYTVLPETFEKLVNSLPHRMVAVIAAKDEPTSY